MSASGRAVRYTYAEVRRFTGIRYVNALHRAFEAPSEPFTWILVNFTTASPNVISGTVTKREGGRVTLMADLIGEVIIEEESIAGSRPATATAPPPRPLTPAPSSTTSTARWTMTGWLAVGFATGPALGIGNTTATNLSVLTERTSAKDDLSLTGSYLYQRTQPASASANNGSLTLVYTRPVDKTFSFMTRNTYSKDVVQLIDHRFTSLNGIGFRPLSTPRVTLTLVPGAGFTTTRHDVSHPVLGLLFAGGNDTTAAYGVFDSLTVRLGPSLAFTQTFLHLRAFSNTSQYISQTTLSLVGMVSQRVGLSIAFNSNYDSQLPEPYVRKATSTLTSGMQLRF